MLESLVPKLMEIKGWNTTKLMLECNISWANASGLRHGNIPGPKTMDKLCGAMKVQPGDVIRYVED